MADWKRNIVVFLSTQTMSLFGSALVQYAIMWYITLSTKSGAMMTISIICGFLPTFFLSPFAGVWADRYNRKRLIILADALIAVATLVMAILFMLGYEALWLLFVISVVRSIGNGIQSPAVGALVPDLVPTEQLTRVNAANGSIQGFVTLTAPLAAAALLSVAPFETILFIDVVTAAIAIVALTTLVKAPVHAKAAQRQNTGYLNDLREGFAYIGSHPFLLRLFVFTAAFGFFMAPGAFLTPLQVVRSFGDEVWRLSAIEVAFAAGMLLGGVVMGVWGGLRNRVRTMTLAFLTMGFCTLALGLVPVFWLYLFFMGLFGLAMPVYITPANVLLQEKVEEGFLGRIFGVLTMLQSSMMPLGMLVFGPIADAVPIESLLVGTGAVLLVQGLILASNRILTAAGEPA